MTARRLDLWERFQPELGKQLADLLSSSGVTDYEPLSMEVVAVDAGHDVYVKSRRRGRIRIGILPVNAVQARLLEIAIPYVEELEAERDRRTAQLVDARRQRSEDHRKRAQELREAGLSVAQIAVRMSAERGRSTAERTVSRWLKDKKP